MLVEHLKFRKYLKADLVDKRIEEVTPKPGNEIVLSVNPKQIVWDKPRIIEKTRTQKPGRFVFADWGMDTVKIKITGQTGNMQLDQDKVRTDGYLKVLRLYVEESLLNEGTISQIMEYVPYSVLLGLNANYNKFKDLENMYLNFDMNEHVMVLIIADEYRRVVMTNFSFTHSTENPWNWEYSIDLEQVSLVRASMSTSGDIENGPSGDFQEHPKDSQIA